MLLELAAAAALLFLRNFCVLWCVSVAWFNNVCVGGYKCEWGIGASGIDGGGHEHATSAVGCVEAVAALVLLLLLLPPLLSSSCCVVDEVCLLADVLNVGAVCCAVGVVGVVLPAVVPTPASLEALELSS